MNQELKNALLEIIKNESEDLIHEWVKLFDEDERDDEYRYYDDFLGFFEECVEAGLQINSPETEALKKFLEKLIEIKGEDRFFNFKDRDMVYTSYIKLPILKKIEEKGLFTYENVVLISNFFESLTSKIIIEILEKNESEKEITMKELEERESPIAKIWYNTIMLSIVGSLDSHRILKIIDKVLVVLEKSEIEHVIVDIGAIYDVNSEVARQLIKLNNAIHYMGAEAYLTGITPAIAKSLTHLDLSLSDIQTFSTTQKALQYILNISENETNNV